MLFYAKAAEQESRSGVQGSHLAAAVVCCATGSASTYVGPARIQALAAVVREGVNSTDRKKGHKHQQHDSQARGHAKSNSCRTRQLKASRVGS